MSLILFRTCSIFTSGIAGKLETTLWLELDSEEGKDYWEAMELCGRYAAANHELIHKHVIAALDAVLLRIR